MIFLIRHGETESDEEKWFIGWSDVPLSENGIEQARAWQKAFADTKFESIYCSDLSRARCTAEIIYGKRMMPICEIPAMREINLGELENLSMGMFASNFRKNGKIAGTIYFRSIKNTDIDRWANKHA